MFAQLSFSEFAYAQRSFSKFAYAQRSFCAFFYVQRSFFAFFNAQRSFSAIVYAQRSFSAFVYAQRSFCAFFYAQRSFSAFFYAQQSFSAFVYVLHSYSILEPCYCILSQLIRILMMTWRLSECFPSLSSFVCFSGRPSCEALFHSSAIILCRLTNNPANNQPSAFGSASFPVPGEINF